MDSEKKYSTLFDTSPDSVTLVDSYGVIIACNESTEKLTGYPKKELIGTSFEQLSLVESRDIPRTRGIIEKVFKGEPIEPYELKIRRKDGSERWIYVITSPFMQDNVVAGIQIIGHDITERKRAMELCQLQIEELKKIDRMKDEFLSITSHELKTPLVPIQGYLDLLAEGKFGELSEKQRNVIGKIRGKETQLKRLVNDLLDLAKLQGGKMVFNVEDVDVNEIVGETVSEMQFLAKENDVEIEIAKKTHLPLAQGDKIRISQVLSNLIENAIKFSPKGEKVVLQAGKKKDKIEISITDSGIGIPEEDLKKIFNEFYQVDSSTSRTYPGTGLGLAICKKIIELHGGRIWAKSEVGGGSTFYFTLKTKKANKQKKNFLGE